MSRIFISHDLGTDSSGNSVSLNELKALESTIDPNFDVFKLGHDQIDPNGYNLPNIPFLLDYITMNCVAEIGLDSADIDLAHLYAGPFTNTIRYLKSLGITTTLTIAAHSREESIKEFQKLGIEYPFNHIKDDRLWRIYNSAVREADVLIAPSKISEKILKDEGAKIVEVIPHGVNIPDDNKVWPIGEGTGIKDFDIGYMGAIGPDKGLKYLIDAWMELDYSDSILKFAGGASGFLGPIIKRQLEGASGISGGIGDRPNSKFMLLGYVKDIAEFYNDISVYVQPSVTEGFGMEVLEAMSYGRPVIVSDGCGAADVVKDMVNGFIVPKRDPKAIADAIDLLKNNPKELIEMGKNAQITAMKYSWDIIRNQYIELWRSLT